MSNRQWLGAATAIVAVAAIGYPLVSLAGGRPRFPSPEECVQPALEGRGVNVVYGRVDSPLEADALRDRVLAVGFTGAKALGDGCGRWKVIVEGVPSVEIGQEIQEEARSVDLGTTLELDPAS